MSSFNAILCTNLKMPSMKLCLFLVTAVVFSAPVFMQEIFFYEPPADLANILFSVERYNSHGSLLSIYPRGATLSLNESVVSFAPFRSGIERLTVNKENMARVLITP